MSNSKKYCKFEYFLKKARKIVAEHRAAYQGVYYMKGGFVGEALDNPITEGLSDIAAFATGNPELIPLINAGETAAGGALQGESIGKALGQGALAGGEAFAGTELAGAAANAFPQTASSLGIDAGGNSLTDLLGNTTNAGSLTGPGTIGGDVSSIFGTAAGGSPITPNTGISSTSTSPVTTVPTDASTGALAPSNAPATTPSAGTLGGGSSGGGGGAAPSGLTPDVDATIQSGSPVNTGTPLSNVVNNTGDLSSVGSPASSSNLPGSNLSSGTQGFLNNLSGPQPDALNPSVISASNAASPSGTDASLNQQSTLGSLTGSTSPIDQTVSPSLASASQVAGGNVKAPNSIGQLISDPSLGNLGNALATNIAPLAAAGGIGLDALKGNKQSGAEKNIDAQAAQQGAQGQQLENYLQTGTLPAGEQAGINQSLDSVIASIKSRYASMGMSGSSAEQQDIANAQQQAQAAGAQMQEQLLSTGINETGMSSNLYNQLLQNNIANDTNLSNAISNFASAAAGGGNFGKGGQIVLNTSQA